MDKLNEQIEAFFDPKGPLSELFPNYEPRLVQVQMAKKIASLLKETSGILAVEAGTGTGKSLAYLSAVLLSDKKVIISTATKTLQDQLFYKDLPLALKANRKISKKHKQVMIMKGRSNYLCLLKAKEFNPSGELFNKRNQNDLDQIFEFIAHTKTGDKAEIPNLPDDAPYWSDLSTTSETCLGQKCPLYFDCFVTRMRNEAKQADVIIVNHALLCADRSLRTKTTPRTSASKGDTADTGAQILPDTDLWIIDEAHSLADIATRHFGFSLPLSRIYVLSRDLNKLMRKCQIENLAGFRAQVESLTQKFFKLYDQLQIDLKNPEASDTHDTIDETLNLIGAGLTTVKSDNTDDLAVAESLRKRTKDIKDELNFMLGPKNLESGFVSYLEKTSKGPVLTASPVDASQILKESLWPGAEHAVLTSATLAVNGKLENFLETNGLSKTDTETENTPVQELILPTVFDFPNRSAFYMPRNLHTPQSELFQKTLDDEIRFLVELSRGGALLLFTSYRVLEASFRNLKDEFEGDGLQVFKQGSAPKRKLIESFVESDQEFGGVLFATHSFWEGVDIQGKALRMVVIDRLPFKSPEDPVLKARSLKMQQAGLSPFLSLFLPEAALTLKQGAGRLLRTQSDAGVVALMDGRISQKNYGSVFLNTLPPMRKINDRNDLRSFWDTNLSHFFC